MALEKKVEVALIEVKGEFSIQVRTATKVMDSGSQIGGISYHRHVVNPDSILTSEDAKVKKIAEALWGNTEKEAYFVHSNGHPSGQPANSWTVVQLKTYLKNNGISYTESEAKSSLLTKAKDKYNEND